MPSLPRTFARFDPTVCKDRSPTSYWGGGVGNALDKPVECHSPTFQAAMWDTATGNVTIVRMIDRSGFEAAATPWEKKHCLPFRKKTMPVVNEKGAVIGHIQKRVGSHVYVPWDFVGDWKAVRSADVPLLCDTVSPPDGWRKIGTLDEYYWLMIDIHGQPLLLLNQELRAGAVNVGLGPIDYLFLGSLGVGVVKFLAKKLTVKVVKGGLKTLGLRLARVGPGKVVRNPQAKVEAARKLAGELPKRGHDLVFVEIGAGDLKASLEIAKHRGVKVIAVDPVAPANAAIKRLEQLGGKFVKGNATKIDPNSADHVFQYLPWRIEGTGSHVSGGTWRLIDDTHRILRPNGAAHFVTESRQTAEYLVDQASKKGFRAVLTESKAGTAAPHASGAGVPNFSSSLPVWQINIYK